MLIPPSPRDRAARLPCTRPPPPRPDPGPRGGRQ